MPTILTQWLEQERARGPTETHGQTPCPICPNGLVHPSSNRGVCADCAARSTEYLNQFLQRYPNIFKLDLPPATRMQPANPNPTNPNP